MDHSFGSPSAKYAGADLQPLLDECDPITIVLELAGGTWGTYNARVALLIVFFVLAAFSLFTFQKSSRNAVKSFTWEDREHLKVVGLCVVWLFSFLALPFLLAPFFSHPIIRARYVIAASMPLYLLVSKGIRNINYSYAKFAVIAIIVILSAANLQAYYGAQRNPTVANAIDFVNKNAKNGDLVIVFPNPGVFPYYSYRSDLKVITFPDNYSALWTKTTAHNMEELKVDTLGHPRVWLVTTQVAYTEALTKPVFDSMKLSYNLTLRGLNCSNNPDVRLYVERTGKNLSTNKTK